MGNKQIYDTSKNYRKKLGKFWGGGVGPIAT